MIGLKINFCLRFFFGTIIISYVAFHILPLSIVVLAVQIVKQLIQCIHGHLYWLGAQSFGLVCHGCFCESRSEVCHQSWFSVLLRHYLLNARKQTNHFCKVCLLHCVVSGCSFCLHQRCGWEEVRRMIVFACLVWVPRWCRRRQVICCVGCN